MSDDNTAQSSPLERHFQTSVQIILVGLCGWMAMTIHNTSVSMASLQTELANLKSEVVSLRSQNAASFTDAQADAMATQWSEQLLDLKTDYRRLEDRLRRVESQ